MIIFKSAPYDDTDAIADLGKVIVVDSNVAEDATHAEWDVATNYTAGDIVKITAQHKLYESITGGTGHNPVSTLGTNWIEIGATNRWRAFDQYIQSRTVADVDDITYELQTNTLITAIAFFNLSGKSLTVRVYDDPSDVLFEETRVLIDQTALVDWFEYFYAETTPQTEVVILGLPGFTGYTIEIEIEGTSSPAAVGEIAIGKQNNIGDLLTGGRIGQLSFSGVNEDVFGNLEIVPRDAAKLVDYPLSWPSSDTRRIEKILEEVRDQPTVFLGHENCAESEAYGMLSYGFYREFDISIVSRSVVFATITVRTLT